MVTLGLGLWLLFGLGVDTFDQASLDPSSTGCRALQTHNHFRVFGRSAVIMLEPQIVATCHHNYNPNARVVCKSVLLLIETHVLIDYRMINMFC